MITGLIAMLKADAAVTAALPGGVQPVLLPLNATLPCATYQVISCVPLYDLSANTNSATVRLQIDVWSTTSYAEVVTAAQAISDCLDSYDGELSDGAIIDDIRVANRTDHYVPDNLAYRIQTDFVIRYHSAA